MHIDRPRGVEAGTPHEIEELIAVKRHAREASHRGEEVELFRRQRKLLLPHLR